MQALYRFYVYYGRMGNLEGLFVADSNEIETLIGKEVYFGEVLGKHSEVFVKIEKNMFKELTTDSDFIKKFLEFGCKSGFNPLDYYEEEENI